MTEMRPLTSSEMRAWQFCQRGWYLAYYRCLRRRRDFASLPNIGTLCHAGLESFYDGRSGSPVDVPLAMGDKLISEYPEHMEQILKDVELARIMLEGYLEWLEVEGEDSDFEYTGAEQMLEVALVGTDFTIRGKIDARMRRLSDGALLQLEHKTVGDLVTIPKYAQSAPQFLTYDLLAYLDAMKGGVDRTDGIVINMLRRVKRTPRANPPFYKRFVVRHNDEELRSHFKHIVAIANQIRAAKAQLDAGADHHLVCPPAVDKNHTYACICAGIGNMIDDGSDAEGYLSEFFEEVDPMDRYNDVAVPSA